MDRAAYTKRLAATLAAIEGKITANIQAHKAALVRHADWRKPEQDVKDTEAEWKDSQSALDRIAETAECELRRHAAPFLSPARARLSEVQQQTMRLIDRGGGASNRAAVGARLEAIKDAIDQLDALAVSGENDLTAAARRVMRILGDFEIDPKYDVEITPPASQQNKPFQLVEG